MTVRTLEYEKKPNDFMSLVYYCNDIYHKFEGDFVIISIKPLKTFLLINELITVLCLYNS